MAELERCAKLGFKGINLNKFPSGRMTPSSEDDRFWAAAVEMDMPVTIHSNLFDDVGSREREGRGEHSRDTAVGMGLRTSKFALLGARDVLLMTTCGVFERFPTLQVYLAENQIGWVPNCMEQADVLYRKHYPWRERYQGFKPLPEPPSFYLKRNVVWGFFDNPVGVQLRHYLGVDHIAWSSDFPHSPSDWPNSLEVIRRNFAGVPDAETYQMVVGNTLRFFHLEPTFQTTEEREQRVANRRGALIPA
jgi:predicted TIM-barrel fold metal-dependent hydrolase